jgi:hypothetical protein
MKRICTQTNRAMNIFTFDMALVSQPTQTGV